MTAAKNPKANEASPADAPPVVTPLATPGSFGDGEDSAFTMRVSRTYPKQAAGTANTFALPQLPTKGQVTSATWRPDVDFTVPATTTFTLQIQATHFAENLLQLNLTPASGTQTMGVAVAVPVSGSPNLQRLSTDVLTFTSTTTGTAVDPGGTVDVFYVPRAS